MTQIQRRVILGAPIDAVTMSEALSLCAKAIAANTQLCVGVVNVAKLVSIHDDSRLREALAGCNLIVADGLPIVWASRLISRPVPERVAGIDLFERLLQMAGQNHWSIYMLGATDAVLAEAIRIARKRFPGIRIAGSRNGYFTEREEPEIAAEIRDSGADLLFVGTPTPKKEHFLHRWSAFMGVSVCHGVGGSFDVLAGHVRRAPRLVQRSGLEWAFRLLQEPRRLWKRYLVTNMRFFVLLLRSLADRKSSSNRRTPN